MIVVAPWWPMMYWFWDLVNQSTTPPLQLLHWSQKQPFSQKYHQNLLHWHLHAWHLNTTQNLLYHSLSRGLRDLGHLMDPHLGNVWVMMGHFELWYQQNKVAISEPTVSNIPDFLIHLLAKIWNRPLLLASQQPELIIYIFLCRSWAKVWIFIGLLQVFIERSPLLTEV